MTFVRAALREPLLHFLLLAVILYGFAAAYARATDPRRIEVTDAVLDSLAARYEKQFGTPPSKDQLAALADEYVVNEALYRKGLDLGLDAGDEVVRRRVVQKMEFLAEGDAPGEPSDATLERYFHAHRDRYAEPGEVSFTQLYFSPDKGGEKVAQDRARAALRLVQNGGDADSVISDSFGGGRHAGLSDRLEVERLFGRGPFVEGVFQSRPGMWSGPFRSGYGWHLVRVENHAAGRIPPFEDVREVVRENWLGEQRVAARKRERASALRDFEVVRQDGGAALTK